MLAKMRSPLAWWVLRRRRPGQWMWSTSSLGALPLWVHTGAAGPMLGVAGPHGLLGDWVNCKIGGSLTRTNPLTSPHSFSSWPPCPARLTSRLRPGLLADLLPCSHRCQLLLLACLCGLSRGSLLPRLWMSQWPGS